MKPSASSASNSLSSRPAPETERPKASTAASAKNPSTSRPSISSKDSRDSRDSKDKPSCVKSPPPASAPPKEAAKETVKGSVTVPVASPPSKDGKNNASASRDKQDDDGGGTDGNSEAETIVLSKDGSPAKPRSRKIIKHEDKRNGDAASSTSAHDDQPALSRKQHVSDKKEAHPVKSDKASANSVSAADGASAIDVTLQQKKKRLQEKQHPTAHLPPHPANKRTSSLNSVPASPPRNRQHSSNPQSGSDSDRRPAKSPKLLPSMSKDKLRPPEKLIPNKRKAPKTESDDEGEIRKARRPRLSGAGAESDSVSHPTKNSKGQPLHGNHNGSKSSGKSATSRPSREQSHNRSISPQPRAHRRSLSTQLPSQSNGLGLKKKRVPAPLQSTDYHSDESSASGSPHIRSSRPRSLATPATADSNVSPAKVGPHKKHLDAHGQTFLARACARGEYDLAKQRLEERPEDLDVADFAGNTPLQIAALNGYGNIVKLLIDAGCNIDCVNYDRETPLLDAVDNGHLEVVKLLLDAGVSPRKANVNGEEPLDRVTDDIDNAAEIRAALISARKKDGDRRHLSEEHRNEHEERRSQHSPDSPQRSPAPSGSHATANGRRAGTARAQKTSNYLLYMPMDDKTLRLAAGRGDQSTVLRILQVREAFDDPESMVAAARGGHDIVMQLLLALGNASPDPEPISSAPAEHATPMLAAIGQENIKVVKLLLEQGNFDPTRRFHGNAYYEIARQRAGPNWKEEEDLLKKAYDKFKKAHNGKEGKPLSPARKDPETRRVGRPGPGEESSHAHKRKLSSPSQERGKKPGASRSSTVGASTSPREERLPQKRSEHSNGKHKRDDRSSVVSVPDRDTPPPAPKQIAKSKKSDPETMAASSEGETVKPRRKLISGRELKDEKEKQRRASMASGSATPSKESINAHESRHDDASDKARAEKHRDRDRDRARQLKNEESRESATTSGEGTTKRHRMSETPPRLAVPDKDASEAPIKRRRLDGDSGTSGGAKERRASDKSTSSSSARDAPATSKSSKRREDDDRKGVPSLLKAKSRDVSTDRGRKSSAKPPATEKSIHVKSEDVDVEMADVSADASPEDADVRAQRAKDDEKKAAQAAEASKRKEEETKRKREEESKRRREEEKRKREEEEARLREEEEKRVRLEEEKRREEEKKRKRQLEEEERKRKEEEKKRKEEEEQRQREEEKERKRKEEEERKKRAEEERLRREQLEREAAEEARRKREDEERKERERQEREHEERERARAEREAEEQRRRQLEEEERVRISKLPAVLRWLSTSSNAKTAAIARKFRVMQGVRYDCIDPTTNGTPAGREQWLMNTQVALILGDKDLSLSKYPTWQHAPVSTIAKRVIWRLETDRYALTDPELYDLGKQLPDYYESADPDAMGYRVAEKLRGEAWAQFVATDMFFVKASEVMDILPSIPHLHDVRLVMAYRELPEDEAQLSGFTVTQKWKNDPDADRFYGFAPRNKYYVNGQMVKEERPCLGAVSKTPFPEVRVPRRGYVAVAVDDPDFGRLCKEQGIDPVGIAAAQRSPPLSNGAAHSPEPTAVLVNGKAMNGENVAPVSPPTEQLPRHINGINGVKGT